MYLVYENKIHSIQFNSIQHIDFLNDTVFIKKKPLFITQALTKLNYFFIHIWFQFNN